MKKIRNVVVALTLVVLTAGLSFRAGQKFSPETVKNGQTEQLDLSLMWQVKARLEDLYLDKDRIDETNMVYGAIGGLVDSLGDPYTVFLPPKDNKKDSQNLAGEFGGVGISLGYIDRILAVMSPLAKTPAEKAGLKAGDLILKIVDERKGVDKDTVGISLDEAVSIIRGEVGTKVTLKILRQGEGAAMDVELVRDKIVVPSIELEWLARRGQKVAWVKLYKFTDNLFDEWPKVVAELKGVDHQGTVLDVRNNPGGRLQASVMVASDFVSEGVIVSQKDYRGRVERYQIDRSRRGLLNEPLVVLINQGSASAAEIVAGALKHYDRAKLVGQTSFGKGTVQQPEDFSDGSGIHVTIAEWLLPGGENLHEVGVEPDVEVSDDPETEEVDEQLEKAIEQLL